MAFLIDRYFQGLPDEIDKLSETRIVYNILAKGKGFNYTDFIIGLTELEKKHATPTKAETKTERHATLDYRIRNYTISHFRKFDEENGRPYMMSFLNDNEEIASLFLVGKNGYGKTSLFNGLEYIYTNNHISTMTQRSIDNKESFLPYGGKKMEDIKITIEINSKEEGKNIIFTSPIQADLDFRPFFCSELDLQEIQRNNNLSDIFSKNLGLDEINAILMQMNGELKNFQSSPSQHVLSVESIPNADILQSDIFLLTSIKERTTYNTLVERLRSIYISADIKNIQGEKARDGIVDMDKVYHNINTIVQILNTYKELKQLVFFKEKLPAIEKYNQVNYLKETESLLDAYELYVTLPPIETFAKELYDYVSYFSQKFFDEKQNYKPVSKTTALKYIEELVKYESEREQQLILEKDRESTTISHEHIENLKKIYEAMRAIYQEDQKNILETCKNTIPPLLNKFTKLGDISADTEQIEIMENKGEIHAVIRNNNIFKGETTTPKLFYNSFRYKLYCISIKVALAFMTMKLSGIKAPIVFDDVFNASDFDNSINIDQFFKSIFKSFKELKLGNEKDLQIILFTHDEVVLNSVAGIMKDIEEHGQFECITGILLDTKALDDKDFEERRKAYMLYEKIN